ERLEAVALLHASGGCERASRARGRPAQLPRVQANVELGEVEAEELDPSPELGEAAICEPLAAVRAQAPVDQLEVGEQPGGRVVAAVAAGERLPEAVPDERQLAPVRLALVRPPDPRRVRRQRPLLARDRPAQLRRDGDQAVGDAEAR